MVCVCGLRVIHAMHEERNLKHNQGGGCAHQCMPGKVYKMYCVCSRIAYACDNKTKNHLCVMQGTIAIQSGYSFTSTAHNVWCPSNVFTLLRWSNVMLLRAQGQRPIEWYIVQCIKHREWAMFECTHDMMVFVWVKHWPVYVERTKHNNKKETGKEKMNKMNWNWKCLWPKNTKHNAQQTVRNHL